jgi:hypothetical protein
MKHPGWQEEWDALRAERELARRKWRRASHALGERAKDPLGVKSAIRKHPLLAAAVTAGAGALIGRLLFGGGGGGHRRHADDDEPAPSRNGHGGSAWSHALQSVAMQVATPLLTHFITNRLADFFEKSEAATTPDVEA